MTATQPLPSARDIAVVVLRGLRMSSLGGFIEVLEFAQQLTGSAGDACCRYCLVAPEGPLNALLSELSYPARSEFPDLEGLAYVAIVGDARNAPPAVVEPLRAFLSVASRRGIPLIGLGSGTASLLALGLMHDRKCCVNWYDHERLAREFPTVDFISNCLFLVDGDRITCADGASSLDLAAWLVRNEFGEPVARQCQARMMHNAARAPQSPQPVTVVDRNARSGRLGIALRLIDASIHGSPSIDHIARSVCISRRQLERLFQKELGMTFRDFCGQRRLLRGIDLLASSVRSVTDIAYECGFADSAHFARSVRKQLGRSPSELRARTG